MGARDLAAVAHRQHEVQARLEELAARPGLLGAAVVRRDGLRVLDAWRRELWNKETFSAMSATLMGAAEIALSELGGADTGRVIAETSQLKMVVTDAGAELLLVALAEADLGLAELLPAVEEAAAHIAQALAS